LSNNITETLASMIHIATVHYQTPKWVEIQYRYLQKNLSDFRLYGFFDKSLDRKIADKYYFASFTDVRRHDQKLDLLADIICHSAQSVNDIIIFLDSDAFPVAPVDKYIRTKLSAYPLIAIRRDEDNGTMHPHPAFCATQIKTWLALQSSWRLGPTGAIYQHTGNPHMDTGGALLESLKSHHVSWYNLRRTNKIEIDSLSFGFYDSVIYHHGNGGGWSNEFVVGEERTALEQNIRTRLFYFLERVCLVGTQKLLRLINGLRDRFSPLALRNKELKRSNTEKVDWVFQIILDDISCEKFPLLETEGSRLRAYSDPVQLP